MHADHLKSLRMRLLLSQTAVARLAGCTNVAISHMESGRNCVQGYVLEALAQVTALDVEERRRAYIRSGLAKLNPMERIALDVDHMAEV